MGSRNLTHRPLRALDREFVYIFEFLYIFSAENVLTEGREGFKQSHKDPVRGRNYGLGTDD